MLVMTDLQRVRLALVITNPAGNPAPVEGPPRWTLAVPNVVDLTVDPDGMAAWATSVGAGETEVRVEADANLSPATTTLITGALGIQVLPSEATSVVIVAGTPELKVP